MIISASRRTDIPAFYSEWFFNRIKEGFVYVRNPMNIHQISKISLDPKFIDCIVFWSKNPQPMISKLKDLEQYMYYFQFTINPYNKTIEKFVPTKRHIIDTFCDLSDKIGSERVIWRYDPIILTPEINIEYHVKYFEELAKRLQGRTKTCVISFLDLYKKTERNLQGTESRELSHSEMFHVAEELVKIGRKYGISLQTCAEKIELECIGIPHGHCIDNILIEDLLGVKLIVSKDKNQRPECGCVQSIDIGEYNTCIHNCKYCYANFNSNIVHKKIQMHNPLSPLLIGEVGPADKITERKIASFKDQGRLFR